MQNFKLNSKCIKVKQAMGVCCSKMESNDSEQSKRQKLCEHLSNVECKIPAEIVNTSNFTIFNLDIDCFDEIFEYLSLSDLKSFGQTCKTMQQVAGEYFKRNYSSAKIVGGYDGICVDPHNTNRSEVGLLFRVPISGFEQFALSLTIFAFGSPYKYIEPYIDQFSSVKDVNFKGIQITRETMKPLYKILRQIETVQLGTDCNCHDLHDILLKFCGNLKRLYVQNADFDFLYYGHFGKRKWLMQNYSDLEHFEYIPRDSLILDELNSFIERNKKIHTFGTSADCLWKNRHAFKNSEAKLDIFEVKCAREFGSDEPTLQSMCELINQLHEQGFYKKLHLYVQRADEEFNTQVVSLNGLEKLCIKGFSGSLPPLTNLKELAILDYFNDLDETGGNGMEILANDLENLQRLFFCNADSIDVIMPFIRRSRKLNKIKIFFKNESRFNKKILNLLKLNKERGKISEARKTTIYVSDINFVATKRTTKNGDTNLSLIELKRNDSYEWYQHF